MVLIYAMPVAFSFLRSGEDPYVGDLVDLWRDHGPAYGENGTFSGYLYSGEAVRVIKTHAEKHLPQHPGPEAGAGGGTGAGAASGYTPLFMYLAWHLVHSPLEVPSLYFDPKCADNKNRQLYHGMVTALDQGVGNVTRALRDNGMLENSLVIFYADNGGPLVTTGWSKAGHPLSNRESARRHLMGCFVIHRRGGTKQPISE